MAIDTTVTRSSALAAVERVRPVIEQYRDQAEQERNLPAPIIEALRSEGLLDLMLPREYGGAELDLPAYLEVIEALARIDSATGWVFTNVATAASQAAYMTEAGARKVYGAHLPTAGAIMPRGRAVPVEGGYRVSGRWSLVSGALHAAWLGGCCLVFEGDAPRMGPGGAPYFTLMYFPREDCTVIDTWHSTGMRGTGSNDFAVEDVFVPTDRTFPLFTGQSHVAGHVYKMRLEMIFLTALGTVGLGIARSAIDAFVTIAREKTPTLSQTGLATRPTIHAEVAKAEANLQSARAFIFEVARALMEAATSAGAVPEDLELRRRLACMHAAEACEEVVDKMYRLGGSTSIQAGQTLDRCLRDIHSLSLHLAVSPVWWEKTGQAYFGMPLGMP